MHVKSLIEKLGRNDTEIAKALGVHRTTVSRIRRDLIDDPNKARIKLLNLQIVALRRRKRS